MNHSYQEGAFFMAITKEQLRQIIKENDINSVGDVYSLLRKAFKICYRNFWRQKWMRPSVIQKTRRKIMKQIISEMGILRRL